MNYWLMKSEPDTFSIDDLAKRPKQTEPWDGVRNYQVRNWLRDSMQVGDLAFFYHSSCKIPGIVGIIEIVKAGYPDASAFDPQSPYFDSDSNPDKPRWFRVDVRLVKKFPQTITLNDLRSNPALRSMRVLERGSRLSITPVTEAEWKEILAPLSRLRERGRG